MLILGVIGSIYTGIAPATEAASLGVLGALLLSYLQKSLNLATFKSSLFGVIENQKQKRFLLQPISISYSKLDGLPIETNFRPFFAWFGNMDLVPHFWKFLGLGLSEVKVKFHKPIKFCDFEDRKHAASYSHEIISSQISKDLQTVEVEKKIRLNEFKLL